MYMLSIAATAAGTSATMVALGRTEGNKQEELDHPSALLVWCPFASQCCQEKALNQKECCKLLSDQCRAM